MCVHDHKHLTAKFTTVSSWVESENKKHQRSPEVFYSKFEIVDPCLPESLQPFHYFFLIVGHF